MLTVLDLNLIDVKTLESGVSGHLILTNSVFYHDEFGVLDISISFVCDCSDKNLRLLM